MGYVLKHAERSEPVRISMQVGLRTGVAGWPIIESWPVWELSGRSAIYKVVRPGLALVRIARAGRIDTWKRSQSCVRYRCRRGVEVSLWATAIIRAARTVMVTLLRSPGRAIAQSVTGRGSKAPSKQPCRIQTLAIRTAAAA